jgi:hypothetical protein
MKQVQITNKEIRTMPQVVPVIFPQPEIKECPFRFGNVVDINRYCITGACTMWVGGKCALIR